MSPAAEPASPPRTWQAKVLSAQDECEGVKTFRLEAPADFRFIPGMFVMVHFADQPKHPRAYSIASSPFERGSFEISCSKVGELTERLFALKGGETLEVKGPYGKWHYRDADRHAVLISGGTGLTPFRSMCRYVLEGGLPNKLTVLYSAQTPSSVLYRRELGEFARAGLKIYVTITRPQNLKPGEAWSGPTGRLDAGTAAREVEGFAGASYYLCGPVSMVESLTKGLLEKGIPKERVHYEKWGDY